MAQEYFINSQELEAKIRQLLPSQGGAGAGVDLSASTQIVPIIDLTEQAEGSNVRQDLQTAFSFDNITSFDITNTTTTIASNTGYFRVFGVITSLTSTSVTLDNSFFLNNATGLKELFGSVANPTTNATIYTIPFDFVVLLKAGEFLTGKAVNNTVIKGSTRQIANIAGELIDP